MLYTGICGYVLGHETTSIGIPFPKLTEDGVLDHKVFLNMVDMMIDGLIGSHIKAASSSFRIIKFS